MNLVIHFKPYNKSSYELLYLNMLCWNKYYNISNTYVIGEFDKNIMENIKKIPFNFEIFNIKNPFDTKDERLNYQLIYAYFKLDEKPFISSHIDIFPIKNITEEHLNKEYKKYGNLHNFTPSFWHEELRVKVAELFEQKFNLENPTIYGHHRFNYITEDFMEFFLGYGLMIYPYPIIQTYYLELQNKDIFYKDLIGTTFEKNKWVFDENKDYKGVNITIPTHPKSKELMNKIYKKVVDENR